MTKLLDFTECEACSAKPGSPQLCDPCFQNRRVIYNLRDMCRDAALAFRQLGRPQEAVVFEGALGIEPVVTPRVRETKPPESMPGITPEDRVLMGRFCAMQEWAAGIIGIKPSEVAVGIERDAEERPDVGAYFNPKTIAGTARVVIYRKDVPDAE